MEILSSSFLPRFPQSNLKIPQTLNITCITSFTTFHPIKKTIITCTQSPTQGSIKNKKRSLLPTIFHSLDQLISTYLDSPIHPSVDPKHVLVGNFAPVDELPPTACQVVAGTLPTCLDGGAYIRNGPHPRFIPCGPYHLFDGDGMLHAIKISKGKATFCSRYVKTYKYAVERKMGYPFFHSVFSSFSNGFMASTARCVLIVARILCGHYNPMVHGFGQANTSLALFAGKLFALWEADLPYAIKLTSEGDIITLGRHTLGNNNLVNMTAHPKVDPHTGEVFAFSYTIWPTLMTYFRISSDGHERKDVPIFSMKHASFVHDFAVTKHYTIFPDIQVVIDVMEIMRGRLPLKFDRSKTSRLGVIPRYASDGSEMCWIDMPELNTLHVVNAWEEDDGDTIVIVASNMFPVEHPLERIGLIHSSLENIAVDAKAMKVVTRYVYAALITDSALKAAGIVKLDLSLPQADREVANKIYGSGCYGGEPYFVPREPDNPDADEDDGYLVTYMHDENTEKSKFIVMDARTPNLDIVAEVILPGRVPYGFHGLFVKENDLNRL
ncbi:ccd4,nced4 [Orobanche hederae]